MVNCKSSKRTRFFFGIFSHFNFMCYVMFDNARKKVNNFSLPLLNFMVHFFEICFYNLKFSMILLKMVYKLLNYILMPPDHHNLKVKVEIKINTANLDKHGFKRKGDSSLFYLNFLNSFPRLPPKYTLTLVQNQHRIFL